MTPRVTIEIYDFASSPPEVDKLVFRVIGSGKRAGGIVFLTPARLKKYYPGVRFEEEPPYPEPILAWWPSGMKPLGSDLWTDYVDVCQFGIDSSLRGELEENWK